MILTITCIRYFPAVPKKEPRNTFPHPYSLEDARQFLDICIADEGKDQLARAIEADGKAVGGIAVFVKDDVYEKSAELGYWLSEDYWRQGITSRAVEMIWREAFARFDIVRIFAEQESAGAILEDMLGTIREEILDREMSLSLAIYEYASLGHEALFIRINENAKKRWSRLIDYGMETGEFKKVATEQAVDLILYYYQGLRMRSRVIPLGRQEAEHYIASIREMLL